MTPLQHRLNTAKQRLKAYKAELKTLGLVEMLLPLLSALLLVVAVFFALLGHYIGLNRGKQIAHITTGHNGQQLTVDDIKALHLENELLKTQIKTLTQERDIALINASLLKTELGTLGQTPMTVGDDVRPLQILSMSLIDEGSATYAYRFEVATKHLTANTLTAQLTLLTPTSLVDIPQTQYDIDADGVVVHGRFVMPANFHPNQIRLTLSAGGQQVVKLYDWQVQQ